MTSDKWTRFLAFWELRHAFKTLSKIMEHTFKYIVKQLNLTWENIFFPFNFILSNFLLFTIVMYIFHSLKYRSTPPSYFAYPFWRVYSNPLQHCSCESHPTMSSCWQLCHRFPAAQWLPALPVWWPCCVLCSRCILVGLLIPPHFWGRQVIPTWLFSGTSAISNTSVTHFAVCHQWDGRAKDLAKTLSFKHWCASLRHL